MHIVLLALAVISTLAPAHAQTAAAGISHFRRDRFGTDSIWFKDRQGRALELNVNSGITEDQAVALAKSAMD